MYVCMKCVCMCVYTCVCVCVCVCVHHCPKNARVYVRRTLCDSNNKKKQKQLNTLRTT